MYDELAAPTQEELSVAYSKLAIIKLNGGLGTGMGCTGLAPLLAGLPLLPPLLRNPGRRR